MFVLCVGNLGADFYVETPHMLVGKYIDLFRGMAIYGWRFKKTTKCNRHSTRPSRLAPPSPSIETL